jgi:hypothetical protein
MERRFEKFRSSGLTVERFCFNEQVSLNTFYYCMKRIGGQPTTALPAQRGFELDRFGQPESCARAVVVVPNSALVHFRFGAVEISLPANCLHVVPCLTLCAQHPQLESNHSFHEVGPQQ